MSHTQVTLKFIVDTSKVQHFLESMTKAANDLEDAYRCPSVESIQDMRCELARGHEETRHQNGTLSWMYPIAYGHEPCPAECFDRTEHHHWRSPAGKDWIFPGRGDDCTVEHLTMWDEHRG